MKKFMNELTNDMHRVFCSKIYVFSILILISCAFLSIYWDLLFAGFNAYIIYLSRVYLAMGLSDLYLVISIIPGFKIYAEDRKTSSVLYYVTRTGKNAYILSKIVTTFISASSIVIIAELIFYFTLSIKLPFYSMNYSTILLAFGTSSYIEYFVISIIGRSMCAGFFGILCLLISMKINNVFVVAASPLLIYYSIERFSINMNIFKYISIKYVSEGLIDFPVFYQKILYMVIFFLFISIVLGATVFYKFRNSEN